ncbi:MAG: hypothetical protein HYZ73_00310, partial [Elusimicrobia bacterium]|nr:hypothetical protein [Elusimicrobiota bacterium]
LEQVLGGETAFLAATRSLDPAYVHSVSGQTTRKLLTVELMLPFAVEEGLLSMPATSPPVNPTALASTYGVSGFHIAESPVPPEEGFPSPGFRRYSIDLGKGRLTAVSVPREGSPRPLADIQPLDMFESGPFRHMLLTSSRPSTWPQQSKAPHQVLALTVMALLIPLIGWFVQLGTLSFAAFLGIQKRRSEIQREYDERKEQMLKDLQWIITEPIHDDELDERIRRAELLLQDEEKAYQQLGRVLGYLPPVGKKMVLGQLLIRRAFARLAKRDLIKPFDDDLTLDGGFEITDDQRARLHRAAQYPALTEIVDAVAKDFARAEQELKAEVAQVQKDLHRTAGTPESGDLFRCWVVCHLSLYKANALMYDLRKHQMAPAVENPRSHITDVRQALERFGKAPADKDLPTVGVQEQKKLLRLWRYYEVQYLIATKSSGDHAGAFEEAVGALRLLLKHFPEEHESLQDAWNQLVQTAKLHLLCLTQERAKRRRAYEALKDVFSALTPVWPDAPASIAHDMAYLAVLVNDFPAGLVSHLKKPGNTVGRMETYAFAGIVAAGIELPSLAPRISEQYLRQAQTVYDEATKTLTTPQARIPWDLARARLAVLQGDPRLALSIFDRYSAVTLAWGDRLFLALAHFMAGQGEQAVAQCLQSLSQAPNILPQYLRGFTAAWPPTIRTALAELLSQTSTTLRAHPGTTETIPELLPIAEASLAALSPPPTIDAEQEEYDRLCRVVPFLGAVADDRVEDNPAEAVSLVTYAIQHNERVETLVASLRKRVPGEELPYLAFTGLQHLLVQGYWRWSYDHWIQCGVVESKEGQWKPALDFIAAFHQPTDNARREEALRHLDLAEQAFKKARKETEEVIQYHKKANRPASQAAKDLIRGDVFSSSLYALQMVLAIAQGNAEQAKTKAEEARRALQQAHRLLKALKTSDDPVSSLAKERALVFKTFQGLATVFARVTGQFIVARDLAFEGLNAWIASAPHAHEAHMVYWGECLSLFSDYVSELGPSEQAELVGRIGATHQRLLQAPCCRYQAPPDLTYHVAELHASIGRLDDALRYYQAARERDTERDTGGRDRLFRLRALFMIILAQHRTDPTDETLSARCEETIVLAGQLSSELPEWQDLTAQARQRIASELLATTAVAQLLLGRRDTAIRLLEQDVKGPPPSLTWEHRLYLIRLYAQTGRLQDAIAQAMIFLRDCTDVKPRVAASTTQLWHEPDRQALQDVFRPFVFDETIAPAHRRAALALVRAMADPQLPSEVMAYLNAHAEESLDWTLERRELLAELARVLPGRPEAAMTISRWQRRLEGEVPTELVTFAGALAEVMEGFRGDWKRRLEELVMGVHKAIGALKPAGKEEPPLAGPHPYELMTAQYQAVGQFLETVPVEERTSLVTLPRYQQLTTGMPAVDQALKYLIEANGQVAKEGRLSHQTFALLKEAQTHLQQATTLIPGDAKNALRQLDWALGRIVTTFQNLEAGQSATVKELEKANELLKPIIPDLVKCVPGTVNSWVQTIAERKQRIKDLLNEADQAEQAARTVQATADQLVSHRDFSNVTLLWGQIEEAWDKTLVPVKTLLSEYDPEHDAALTIKARVAQAYCRYADDLYKGEQWKFAQTVYRKAQRLARDLTTIAEKRNGTKLPVWVTTARTVDRDATAGWALAELTIAIELLYADVQARDARSDIEGDRFHYALMTCSPDHRLTVSSLSRLARGGNGEAGPWDPFESFRIGDTFRLYEAPAQPGPPTRLAMHAVWKVTSRNETSVTLKLAHSERAKELVPAKVPWTGVLGRANASTARQLMIMRILKNNLEKAKMTAASLSTGNRHLDALLNLLPEKAGELLFDTVQGYPGSGKTTILIKEFLKQVLDAHYDQAIEQVTTYYHKNLDPDQRQAVNSTLRILKKRKPGHPFTILLLAQQQETVNRLGADLAEQGIPFIRVGARDEGADIPEAVEASWNNRADSLEALAARPKTMVILSPINSLAGDPAANKFFFPLQGSPRKADVVAIDEGGLCTIPETAMATLYLEDDGELVVVGDQNQVTPFGVGQRRVKEILDDLSKDPDSPEDVKRLTEIIMTVPNLASLEVSGLARIFELHPRQVRRHVLHTSWRFFPQAAGLTSHFYEEPIDPGKAEFLAPWQRRLRLFWVDVPLWQPDELDETLDPEAKALLGTREGRAMFGRKDHSQWKIGTSTFNPGYIQIALDLLYRALNGQPPAIRRFEPDEILVITPYDAQLKAIRAALKVNAVLNEMIVKIPFVIRREADERRLIDANLVEHLRQMLSQILQEWWKERHPDVQNISMKRVQQALEIVGEACQQQSRAILQALQWRGSAGVQVEEIAVQAAAGLSRAFHSALFFVDLPFVQPQELIVGSWKKEGEEQGARLVGQKLALKPKRFITSKNLPLGDGPQLKVTTGRGVQGAEAPLTIAETTRSDPDRDPGMLIYKNLHNVMLSRQLEQLFFIGCRKLLTEMDQAVRSKRPGGAVGPRSLTQYLEDELSLNFAKETSRIYQKAWPYVEKEGTVEQWIPPFNVFNPFLKPISRAKRTNNGRREQWGIAATPLGDWVHGFSLSWAVGVWGLAMVFVMSLLKYRPTPLTWPSATLPRQGRGKHSVPDPVSRALTLKLVLSGLPSTDGQRPPPPELLRLHPYLTTPHEFRRAWTSSTVATNQATARSNSGGLPTPLEQRTRVFLTLKLST